MLPLVLKDDRVEKLLFLKNRLPDILTEFRQAVFGYKKSAGKKASRLLIAQER